MDDKQRMKDFRRPRLRGVRLSRKGVWPAEVFRWVGVPRHSVMRWEKALKSGGFEKMTQLGARGHPRPLSDAQLEELAQLLKQGAIAAGYAAELWTLARIAVLIQDKYGVHTELGLATASRDGLERATLSRTGPRAGRECNPCLETQEVAGAKKLAERQRPAGGGIPQGALGHHSPKFMQSWPRSLNSPRH